MIDSYSEYFKSLSESWDSPIIEPNRITGEGRMKGRLPNYRPKKNLKSIKKNRNKQSKMSRRRNRK